jgi:hypothetical protein
MRKLGTSRFLPDKPFVQSVVIPAGSFLAGLIVYQIVRAVGLYICIAAMFQRGSVDVQSLLQGRTNTPGGPARPAIAERMEKRRSRATNAARNR